MLGFITDSDSIGFTLPETSVTTTNIPVEGDILLANIYSSSMWVLYAISVLVFLMWYHKEDNEHREKIQQWINDNRSLIAGIFTTAITVGIIEGIARIANCSVWSHHSLRNNPSGDDRVNRGVFLAVWLPQGYVLAFGTMLLIGCHIREVYATYRNGDFCMHVILPIHLIAFGLVHALFPAVILILVYAIQMLATLTFVLAYLFATTIFSAIIYKRCEQYCHSTYKKMSLEMKLYITILYFIAMIIPFWIIFLYLSMIAIVFLYTLLIGRGSAINTGPLFAISLLPSLLISSVAWAAKRLALQNTFQSTKKSIEQQPEYEAPARTLYKPLVHVLETNTNEQQSGDKVLKTTRV